MNNSKRLKDTNDEESLLPTARPRKDRGQIVTTLNLPQGSDAIILYLSSNFQLQLQLKLLHVFLDTLACQSSTNVARTDGEAGAELHLHTKKALGCLCWQGK